MKNRNVKCERCRRRQVRKHGYNVLVLVLVVQGHSRTVKRERWPLPLASPFYLLPSLIAREGGGDS